MSECNKPFRGDQPSIAYRFSQVEGASFEVVHKEYTPTPSNSNHHSNIKSEHKSSAILSTAELIFALGQLWDRANDRAVTQPNTKLNYDGNSCQKKVTLENPGRKVVSKAHSSVNGEYFCFDLESTNHFIPMVQPTFEFLKVKQKMLVVECFSEAFTQSLSWRFLRSCSEFSDETWKGKGLASIGISHNLDKVYGWMKEMVPAGRKYPVNISANENNKTHDCCSLGGNSSIVGRCISGNNRNPAYSSVGGPEHHSDFFKSKEALSCENTWVETSAGLTHSLYSDYFCNSVDTKADVRFLCTPNSSLCTDYHINVLASCGSTHEESKHKIDGGELPETKIQQPEKYAAVCKNGIDIHPSVRERPRFILAKQEHAFSGALAGVFVSLCLHPIDTVKTVIQACRAEQKSICYVGKSIVSERGMMGLYRGISSNIASSAPISAIYTFTYESAKGALLPFFPKEHQSVAHCIAGGCASVATSFIFTPSERIKQQMQIGARYNNCWNALVGIIGKGGLPSLYAGWGAVLCRNVPHSIIKFYTYESLKRLMISQKSNAQPSTLQTLVCGGMAGSTASLFTTPFDVVKTRLQTQVPGSMSRYHNCFHALKEIGKREGLKGLYSSLISLW
ncbi:uncharacterized protein LOC119980617 isoform X2 [Tripterygium wilfordii]|uniref:uncharacterized protein LOC119980617 isoform X2 n=1 Tax=Tripterygium wilfordii TaxID=458696 RepID=UPI0018F83C33|nr:uncharacterized protein LOC119980617 isoform X2 [Tripterygium wilfordii]